MRRLTSALIHLSISSCFTFLFVAGCAPELDTTRQPVDDGTFGRTVYTLTCQRLAYMADRADGDELVDVAGATYRDACRNGAALPPDPYPTVLAISAHRAELIAAVDAVFPDAYLPDLQAYLTKNEFLALYDDGTVETAVERTSALFDLCAEDPELAPALARLDGRLGYRPLVPALGALRAVARWEGLDNLLDVFTDAIALGGPAHGEFVNMQRAVAFELQHAQPAPDRGQPDRTLDLALGLLLTESPLLGTGRPRLLVRRDLRGLAIVEADPVTGQLPEPFVDVDGDGWADADGDGRFVDATGLAIVAPAPFVTTLAPETAPARAIDGRALQWADGPPMYRFVDLDRTVLAAVARDAKRLFDPLRGTGLDLLRGASAMLGPRVMVVQSYDDGTSFEYRGFDAAGAALLDLAYGFMQLFRDPNFADTLAVGRELLVAHEPEAARLIEAMLAVADLGDLYPGAKLEPGSPLYDDLIPVVNQILAVPGLAEDLLRALEQPQVQQLGQRFADFMKYRDQLDLDPSSQAIVGTLSTPVDRASADSNWNRSLMQRLLHLIADSSGVTMCNKQDAQVGIGGIGLNWYDECELLRIDDLAVFYVQSIAYAKDAAGNVLWDDGHPMPKAYLDLNLGWLEPFVSDNMMEDQSTIEGFRSHPTPQALNRVLLLNPAPDFIADTMDPAVCSDGDRFIDAHTGTLPVWELNGFYQQIQPIVQAFADHESEALFVALLVVLHQHYPSPLSINHQKTNPADHGYSKMSNVRSFEQMIIDVIENRDLWAALTEGAAVVNGIVAPSGKSSPRVLADMARWLFAPQPGLADRLGNTMTTTEDGQPVATLSPWHLLADAYRAKRARLEVTGSEGMAWERATGEYIDLLMRGENAGGTWRFKNPRFRGVAVALIDFLDARVDAHRASGDLDAWVTTDLPGRVGEILTGPVFAGVSDFVLSLAAAPAARASLEELQAYLFDEAANQEAFQIAVTAAADLAQLFLDDPDMVPVARVLGKALAPEFGLVDAHLEFVKAARDADDTAALARLIGYLFSEYASGKTSIAEIVDVIAEVHRQEPFVDLGQPLSAGDFQDTFRAVADYLAEEKRGLLKFIHIVQERHAHE